MGEDDEACEPRNQPCTQHSLNKVWFCLLLVWPQLKWVKAHSIIVLMPDAQKVGEIAIANPPSRCIESTAESWGREKQ